MFWIINTAAQVQPSIVKVVEDVAKGLSFLASHDHEFEFMLAIKPVMHHCECCHELFNVTTDGGSVDEYGSWCESCNSRGCDPGCYAFDAVEGVECADCGNTVTEGHLLVGHVRVRTVDDDDWQGREAFLASRGY